MEAMKYLLPRPSFEKSPEKLAAFDSLFNSTPAGGFVDYHLPYPKWQFLSYLCETRALVLHGSQNAEITEVEPRQALDVRDFSKQLAIYATTDGIWVEYFAIIDRQNFGVSLFNSCLQARISPDQLSEPFYFFSITQSALVQNPWRTGVVYILPREEFQQEPPQQAQGLEIVFPHWVSRQPARPAAKLLVEPQDFPFLSQVHGHNDETLERLAAANPEGFPWPEALDA